MTIPQQGVAQVVAHDDAPLSAPDKVAAVLVELLDAPLVGVEALLHASSQEFPAFRLRLYVPQVVSGQTWGGIDYHAYRSGGRLQRIELALPAAPFRERVQKLLQDPAAALTGPGEAGVRVVDVWCRHAGAASGHAVQIVKVWHDVPATGIDAEQVASNPTGRVCYDALPVLTECQQVFDFTTLLEQHDLRGIGDADDLPDSLAHSIEVHRAEREALRAAAHPATVQTKRVPGGVTIEIGGTEDFPADICDQKGTKVRSLPTGETFIGLADESRTGTVRFNVKLPFVAGGIAVWAPSRITDPAATLEVEASMDGRRWIRLARLDAASMSDDRTHVLPPATLSKSTLSVRARLTAREDAPPNASANGLRFLDSLPPVYGRFWLSYADESLTVRERPEPVAPDEVRLSVRAQPESLTAADVFAIVEEGWADIDVFPPCELDERACRRIASHPGVIRFWSPSAWQQAAPAWLADMVAGEGRIVFVGVLEPPLPFVKAVAGGLKSLSFPGIVSPSVELLTALAECRGELALDGMEAITPEQSLALARYRGPRLSLAGLRSASLGPDAPPTLLQAAVATSGTCSLPGLTRLEPATAAILAAGQKDLVLGEVTELQPEAARILASSSRGLRLDGLAKLDQATTAALLPYAGPSLSLAALREVECGLDDLRPTEGVRDRSLCSLVAPARTATEVAAADMIGCLAEADAFFTAAVALGVEDESRRAAAMQEIRTSTEPVTALDALRRLHPRVPPSSTVWIGGATGGPLDAIVRAPGVFSLRRREGTAVGGKGRLTQAVARSLARGAKQLDLDGLADIDVDSATALAAATTVVSLDGLRSITVELATALQSYKGPLLSLQGIEMIDDAVATLLEPAVREDRACLAAVDMTNVAGLRTFVADSQQQKRFESFWSLSKVREWSGIGRAAKGRGRVTMLLRNEVVFENDDREARIIRDALSPTSRKQLVTLAKNAAEVAASRKGRLLAVASGREPEVPAPAAAR